jgi:hypothetical protein
MTTTPFYNAFFAIAYIITLVSVLIQGPTFLALPDQSIFYPILALSLLVLSVSLMAYLFFYEPLLMLLDGKRTEALRFFLSTVGIFAAATLVILLLAVFVSGW